MKQILFFLITISIQTFLFSQNPNDAIVTFSNGSLNYTNIKSKPPEYKGSVYIDDNWHTGRLKLFSGEEIRNYPLKSDLRLNEINIKVGDNIKVISFAAIKEFNWINSIGYEENFVNCSLYSKHSNKLIGFFNILYDGKILLLKKTNLKLLESNYVGPLVAGDKDNEYILENKYYVYKNDKLYSIKKNKRKILKILNDKNEEIKKFASENNLKFKNDYDLSKIFRYYDNL